MAITPVSSINFVSAKAVEDKKVTNPIKAAAPAVESKAPEAGALRAYFMGGNAVSFSGFPVSTGGFVTKKIDDVPCCCCGGRMVRAGEMDKKAREFSGIKGEKLADKITEDKDFFRAPQRVVMMLAANEARKHPNYDLTAAKNAAGKGLKEKKQNY